MLVLVQLERVAGELVWTMPAIEKKSDNESARRIPLGGWTVYPLEGRLVAGDSEQRVRPKETDVLALGDTRSEPESILTIPKCGYQLLKVAEPLAHGLPADDDSPGPDGLGLTTLHQRVRTLTPTANQYRTE
jgi:hypothetical protein